MNEQMGTEKDSWKKELRDIYCRVLSNKALPNDYERAGIIYKLLAPKTLFKYYSDNEYSIDNITNDNMWYSSPACFNDVFDVDFQIDKKKIIDDALKQVCRQTGIKKHDPRWIKARQEIQHLTENFGIEVKKLRLTTGVACLSESDNEILMWAHYAHSHKGICVEYDMLEMNEQLRFSAIPVLYSNTRPCLEHIDINATAETAITFLIDNLMTKSPEWSYEREWRIIRDSVACGKSWNDEKHGALLPAIKPLSVILGCEAPGDFEARVTDCCQSRKINLFRMKKDETGYALNKEGLLAF